MKIAIWHNLPSGGGKRALYDQVEGLLKSGHHVEAWCPPSATQDFLPLSGLIKEHVLPLEGSPSTPTGPISRRLYLARDVGQRMKKMEQHCRRCAEEIVAAGFDLIFAHPCQYFHASPIALFSPIPSILYLQEPFRLLYEARPTLPWAASDEDATLGRLGRWNRFLTDLFIVTGKRVQVREEWKWVRRFDQVLVNSFFSRESVMRTYGVDSRVCYLGIDVMKFTPADGPKERYVVGLGSLYFHKRPSFAIKAIAAIPKQLRPKLVWVGNGGKVDEFAIEASAHGVEFEYHILISDSRLCELLSRAAVMIYASYLEPFGYAPLEANACGTAVVGIAEGGIRETIHYPENGILLPHLNPEAFAEALLKFCDDLNYAKEFGKKARRYVEQSWAKEKAIDVLNAELNAVITTARKKTLPI